MFLENVYLMFAAPLRAGCLLAGAQDPLLFLFRFVSLFQSQMLLESTANNFGGTAAAAALQDLVLNGGVSSRGSPVAAEEGAGDTTAAEGSAASSAAPEGTSAGAARRSASGACMVQGARGAVFPLVGAWGHQGAHGSIP